MTKPDELLPCQVSDAMIEKVARAIQQSERDMGKHLVGWESLGPQTQAHLRFAAQAAITAMTAASTVPTELHCICRLQEHGHDPDCPRCNADIAGLASTIPTDAISQIAADSQKLTDERTALLRAAVERRSTITTDGLQAFVDYAFLIFARHATADEARELVRLRDLLSTIPSAGELERLAHFVATFADCSDAYEICHSQRSGTLFLGDLRAALSIQTISGKGMRALVEESLFHLRLDEAAENYHKRALAALVDQDERGQSPNLQPPCISRGGGE